MMIRLSQCDWTVERPSSARLDAPLAPWLGAVLAELEAAFRQCIALPSGTSPRYLPGVPFLKSFVIIVLKALLISRVLVVAGELQLFQQPVLKMLM